MTSFVREWRVGQSVFRLETPGLVRATIRGRCTLDHLIQTAAVYREVGSVRPVFVLADMAEAGGMDAEAGRCIDDHVKPEWFRGFIYFNTRLLNRSVLTGMLIAYELLRREPHPWRGKIHFVRTEMDGRALLARLAGEQLEEASSL